MNEKVRLERPDLVGWVSVETGEKTMKFLRTVSGGQVTIVPDGKILWLEEEVRAIEAERDKWREIACALYNAAHESDHRVMRSACRDYEVAADD